MSEKRNDPVLETLNPADRARFLNMVKKGISRRDFMHYMMAAGATAAASGTLFTGVSDAWANTPKRGGRVVFAGDQHGCLLYTSPSPRDLSTSRMPSSA